MAFLTGHNDKRLLLASIYMPCNSAEHPEEEVEQFLDYCSNKEYELGIGCDVNSYNEARGSTDNNSRGEELLELIKAEDLQICNVGTEPIFGNVGNDHKSDKINSTQLKKQRYT